MRKKLTITLVAGAVLTALTVLWLALGGSNIAVLNPQGAIAAKQRDLIVLATLLMLVVVVPVFIMTFGIAWKYRAGNTKAKYSPDWDHHPVAETIWWGVPSFIILILAVIIWTSSHELDPYKPLESKVKPITIQVVALQWKWLFIYPEQGIATVNEVQFPEDTPVNFEITADAPMNSFWIPQLGGQVYAMAGMETKLHLMADAPGSYNGVSANLSGEGFAGMKFTAKSRTQADFRAWVEAASASSRMLDILEYKNLAKPSENNPVMVYSSADKALYDGIIMKYMTPGLPSTHPSTPAASPTPVMDHAHHQGHQQ